MHIIFARHGESSANANRVIANRGYSYGLTDIGRMQVAALAEHLEGSGATALYTSPLRRTIETAQVLGSKLGLDYTVASALREFDCGVLEGRSDEEAWREHARIFHEWYVEENENYAPKGGENLHRIRKRFKRFIDTITQDHADETVICVGHGGTYHAAIPYFFGVDAELDYADTVVVDTQPFR